MIFLVVDPRDTWKVSGEHVNVYVIYIYTCIYIYVYTYIYIYIYMYLCIQCLKPPVAGWKPPICANQLFRIHASQKQVIELDTASFWCFLLAKHHLWGYHDWPREMETASRIFGELFGRKQNCNTWRPFYNMVNKLKTSKRKVHVATTWQSIRFVN